MGGAKGPWGVGALILLAGCFSDQDREKVANLEGKVSQLQESVKGLEVQLETLNRLVERSLAAQVSPPPLAEAKGATDDCPPLEGVRQIDETSWEIQGEAIASHLSRASCFARAARIVPNFREGRPQGFKLFGIRDQSAFHRLGLQNGDVIRAINDQPLDSPQVILEATSQLEKADEVKVSLERRGQELVFRYVRAEGGPKQAR